MKETVKPCPFCGSSVSVERVPLIHYQGCVIFEIKCLNCGCERTLTKNDSIYRTEEEARANAIAQWNERPSTANVPREMSAVEYGEIVVRMCEQYIHSPCIYCPLGTTENCALPTPHNVAIVEKWVQEHPGRSENE